MKKTVFIICCFTALLFAGCQQEQELDEVTKTLLEKEEKLQELDRIFYLSIDNIDEAEKQYKEFVQAQLITDDNNFLTDNDILERKKMTSLMIQLNRNFQNLISETQNIKSLFDFYVKRKLNEIFNNGQYAEIPPQLKEGELGQTFIKRMEIINEEYDKQFKTMVGDNPTDKQLTGKRWQLTMDVPEKVKESWAYQQECKNQIMTYDITFNANNTLTVNDFFFLPILAQFPGYVATVYAGDFKDLELDGDVEYYVHNNKLFFYFPFADNRDLLTYKGDIPKIWFYEFDYSVANNILTLSNPKIAELKLLKISTLSPDDEFYKDPQNGFPDEFKKLTLTEQ